MITLLIAYCYMFMYCVLIIVLFVNYLCIDYCCELLCIFNYLFNVVSKGLVG